MVTKVFRLTLAAGLILSVQSHPIFAAEVMPEVVVTGQKEQKFLPDVDGAKIYSGKKTSVIDLKEQPTVVNSNYRQALQKTPGLLLSEETTPLLSLGYRGLAPDRAQYTQVLKDGIPIHADMFGYPESYFTPPLEVVDHIEFIRGGASLLYGPQPGGALNFVTKDPYLGPLQFTQQNAIGSHDFFSNYTSVSGTEDKLGYYGYFHHRQSQGFRANNSQYEVFYGGSKFRYMQQPEGYWDIAFDLYEQKNGEPGGLTRNAFDTDSTQSTRLNDHFELNRYAGSVSYEREIDPLAHLSWKTFGGYYERSSWRQRTSASSFGLVPSGANSTSNDILSQKFYNVGTEGRYRRTYEAFGQDEHAFTIGALYYHLTSPRLDKRGDSADATDGTVRKDTDRTTNNVALFMENQFKFDRLSITPGVRLENVWQSVKENINLDKTTVPLANESEYDFVPLFGLGSVYELSESTDVYGNISQGYRPKTFTQAVPQGAGQIVNSDLEEGKSWQADVGVRGTPLSYLYWDASVFYMEFDDQIGSVGASTENVGDARHRGIELASEIDVVKWLDSVNGTAYAQKIGAVNVFSNWMFLDAEFKKGSTEGNTPQYAPDFIFKAGAEYNYLDRAKLRLAGTFLDDHFADDANTSTYTVPSYKVWDLTSEFNVYKQKVSLFAGINNIFDEHYFARVTSGGIDPADGRNYYAGMKLVW